MQFLYTPIQHTVNQQNVYTFPLTLNDSPLLFLVVAVNEAGITYGNQINFTTDPLISDVEGRTYGTASLGAQIWLTENLETTKFNDGEPIPLVENFTEWRILTSPGYYVFSWRHPDIVVDSFFTFILTPF